MLLPLSTARGRWAALGAAGRPREKKQGSQRPHLLLGVELVLQPREAVGEVHHAELHRGRGAVQVLARADGARRNITACHRSALTIAHTTLLATLLGRFRIDVNHLGRPAVAVVPLQEPPRTVLAVPPPGLGKVRAS